MTGALVAKRSGSIQPLADREGLGGLAGAITAWTTLPELAAAVEPLRAAAAAAPVGEVLEAAGSPAEQANGWVSALAGHPKHDLVGTVRAYLRHRGRWEDAARELGLHRNSVRHRIGLAAEATGVDLDDPDVSARLWLALSQTAPRVPAQRAVATEP